ncbi:MAG: alkaline phosphatase family protein [Nitrospirae bacterium]|nr:alkaline phosphatase family protein [Nitrospirota bacterium]
MTQSNNAAAFLGLDGTPYSLVTELMAAGVMPNLKGLLGSGRLMRMETTVPEVSSVAWTSFITGVNPGRHGIYGFMDLKPGGYRMYFPNSGSTKAKTLWDRLTDAGRPSVVLNVPQTYPARPLNGVLTAGFVALDLKKATYPDSAYDYLSGMGYRIDVDTVKARESADVLVDDLRLTLAKRREAILHYLSSGASGVPWDLFVGVVTETDRLHHFLWSAYLDKTSPYHGFFIEFYREIDAFICEFAGRLAEVRPGAPLVIMSDHGFTHCEQEVFVNSWLRENGYLKLAKSPAQSWEDIAPGTAAFALDPSRIYINRKGRYENGSVEDADRTRLADEIAAGLMELKVDGRPVLRAVKRKEELYSGPCAADAPDLVLLSNYGFDLKGSISKSVLHEKGFLTGMHTQDDAMLYISGPAPSGLAVERPNILDASATVAGFLGLDGAEFEGRRLM